MKKIFFILFFSLLSNSVLGITPAELATRAEAAYIRGDFPKAQQDWKELTEIGFVNGSIFNNMGSAYWREGKVGLARLNFLKALNLSPRDGGIRANLEYIQNPGPVEEAAASPRRLLQRIPYYKFNLNFYEALGLAAFSGLLVFGALVLRRWRGGGVWRWVTLVFLIPWIWGNLQLGRNLYASRITRPAILIVPESELLAHPVLGGPTVTRLPEGSELRLIKKQGDFIQVETVEGQKGWLPRQSVGEVG